MTQELIFYPSVAMFALTALVLGLTGSARFRASGSGEMDPRFYKLYTGGEEPAHLRKLSRHLQNHFEVPPLFHLVVIMHFVTDQVGMLSLILAWTYVATRGLHSWMHLGRNYVPHRFASFAASYVTLIALWLNFAAGLVKA